MPISPEHPAWKAWLAYKETASYRHALQSAPEGTLWGAFYEGWQARVEHIFTIEPSCWHFWRQRYDCQGKKPLCEKCLKKHPDYWKWRMPVSNQGTVTRPKS